MGKMFFEMRSFVGDFLLEYCNVRLSKSPREGLSVLITIIDYGIGNLNSVANMIRHFGGTCRFASDPCEVSVSEKLILPGVGAFDCGMDALRNSGILDALNEAVLDRGVPVLGICLGMQLMARRSEEGRLSGLGWLDAEVVKFRFFEGSLLKIPHMGWNTLSVVRDDPLIFPEERQRFYFVHSYHLVCADENDVLATCHYGYEFVAAFRRGNIWGVQFHPEKSHRFGMGVLRRFVEMNKC